MEVCRCSESLGWHLRPCRPPRTTHVPQVSCTGGFTGKASSEPGYGYRHHAAAGVFHNVLDVKGTRCGVDRQFYQVAGLSRSLQ